MMVRVADGDRTALGPAFARASPVVHRFCVRFLGGVSEAEDAAQDALVKVFAHAHELDPARDALAWILGVAAYECRTVRKRRARSLEKAGQEALAAAADGGPTAEDEVIAREVRAAVLDTLGALRASDVETILAALEGRKEAGARFRKRLQRAYERLRAAWSRRYG
jgi:RNA polymerase sigma-70 factor (ECF subfamily)